jgi:hypothetical protein
MLFMVFDVESVGLHGEGFAVGWVVIDHNGSERDSGVAACHPFAAKGTTEGRSWVQEHVTPHLTEEWTHGSPQGVRGAFWEAWQRWKEQGAVLVADCCWPVEARFLAACVDDHPNEREWQGPYPLHDVATARLAAGYDPLETCHRLKDEEPAHHPLCDARQSARLYVDALRECAPPERSEPALTHHW